jgi:hypothetical protein
MRYIALLKAAPPSSLPPPGLMEAIGKLGEEATKAGVLVDTAGLAPSATGARVAVGKDITVTDGPLTGAGELSSYALYEVRDKGGDRVDHPLHADPPQALGGLGKAPPTC